MVAKKRKRKRRDVEIVRRTLPGAPPGEIRTDPDAPHPVLRVMAYGPDALSERALARPQDLGEFMGRWPVTWINVEGLGDAATLESLARLLGVHELALEDVVNVHQRPKVEEYENGLFIVLRMPRLEEAGATEQVSMYLTGRVLVTFIEDPGDVFDPVRDRLRSARGQLRNRGTDYLAYALIDASIDAYFPVLDVLSDRLNELELAAAKASSAKVPRDLMAQRQLLHGLRRVLWPLRDMLAALHREPLRQIREETRIFLRDCHDHSIQLIDVIETYRELTSSLMDLYTSTMSHRMNEVMKVLTVIATVFIPLTFISSIYGMNFNPEVSSLNMPELGWRYGYLFALALMLATALGLLYYFRRKGWLGARESAGEGEET